MGAWSMNGILWLYKLIEPGLWSTGYHGSNGKWYADSYWHTPEAAALRAQYLNKQAREEEKRNNRRSIP